MSRESTFPMLPVPEALSTVIKLSKEMHNQLNSHTSNMKVSESIGLCVSQDITAPCDLPPFPASMKDGYCLYLEEGEDTKGKEFAVADVILAGRDISDLPNTLPREQVYKIMTGAPVPSSCNTVVMVEHTRLVSSHDDGKEEKILIETSLTPLRDVRPVGSDIKQGDVVMKTGEVIGSAESGLLSCCGIQSVSVYCGPIVGVMSTGDEVIDPVDTQTLKPGQIYDANRPLLKGLLHEFDSKLKVQDLGIVPDDPEKLFSALENALSQTDILITSGGVSMGEVDLVKKWMEEKGSIHFGRVLMKPGKPLTFASFKIEGKIKLMFATPGNPVSSYVTSILFVLPCLRILSGQQEANHPRIDVHITHPVRLDPQRPEYHRATVWWDSKENQFKGQSTGSQASSRLLSMRSANALLELPQSAETLQAGTKVSALLIGPLPGPSFVPAPPPKLRCHRHVC